MELIALSRRFYAPAGLLLPFSRSEGQRMTTKAPNPIDRHVGSRVRIRRVMIGMSQETLGEALGLTFQQVQKYEKGTNRIGASRLHRIASVLGVPVEFFYEGAPHGSTAATGFAEPASSTYMSDFLSSNEGVNLVKDFLGIKEIGRASCRER